MSCPKCACKVCYPYYEDDDDSDTDSERCASCGHVFYSEEAIEDEDGDFPQQAED